MLTTPQVGDRGGEASSTRGSVYQLLLGPTDTRVNSHTRSSTVCSESAESPTKFLFKPFNIRMYHGGLHAYIEGREAIPSGATSGLNKPPSSGQAAPSLDLGVRCGPPTGARGQALRPTLFVYYCSLPDCSSPAPTHPEVL